MRTRYSLYNFLVSAISGILVPILGFVKVRLFIGQYGSELNGLNLVFNQVINYINICELSFSLAFRQLLFDPLAKDDREEVKKIYSGVKKVYHFVGILVLAAGFIAAFVLPLFTESELEFSEMVVLFLILSLPFGISYFLLPPTYLIIADQKEYKISIWIQSIAILRMVLIIACIMFKLPYILVFIIEALNVLVSNIVSNRIAHKEYQWLVEDKNEKINHEFVASIRGTLVQRLSNIAITNSDSIILNIAANLNAVSIYGAYTYLIDAIMKVINAVITSPINSFGNLFSEDGEKAYPVFEEYYELASYFATILSVCLFAVLDEFVYIWMHDTSYVMPILTSVIFSLNVFYLTQREAIILVRDANRMFIEAKNNAYLMSVVKIVSSFVLVYLFGIQGVLIGSFLAYFLVDFLYNPKLVYQRVFKREEKEYYKNFFIRLLITVVLALPAYFLYQRFVPIIQESLVRFVLFSGILGVVALVIITAIYYFSFDSFRRLVKRIVHLFIKK